MILVAGATGSLGGRIARAVVAQGIPVRALARPTSDAAALQSAGIPDVHGDVKDPTSLARACDAVDIVITTVSASKRNDDSIENVDLRGNQNLIDAAEAAGVRHFIFVSTIAASEDGPLPLFRAKAAAETRLRGSAMTHTILSSNGFMDVWFPMMVELPAFSGQPITLVGESRRRHSFVAEQDIAAFAAAALGNAAAHNATIVIGGPEAVTFRDVVRAYEEAAGREFPVRSVAPGEPIPGLPEPVWGIAAALETFDSPIPMDDTARRFGVTLTSVRDFARSRLARRTETGPPA
jgi:NADH dehydrogenase